MAADSNASSGFQSEEGIIGSSPNSSGHGHGHAISFQSGVINCGTVSSEMIPMGLGVGNGNGTYFGSSSGGGGMAGNLIMNSGCSSSSIIGNSPGIVQGAGAVGGSCSSGSLLLDSVPGLKHDAGLAVEWTPEEQYKLEEGLIKYANETTIMRYIKIAATLRDKTVRDVALRCRWMMRKRRKGEEQSGGKKVNNRKDKMVDSLSKMNVSSAGLMNSGAYSFMIQQMGQNEHVSTEGISGTAKNLFEQNAQAFSLISANLSQFKLEDNIDLFRRTRNNLTTILNDMRDMPGIMSQMPPLPVSINEDLANSILPSTTQGLF